MLYLTETTVSFHCLHYQTNRLSSAVLFLLFTVMISSLLPVIICYETLRPLSKLRPVTVCEWVRDEIQPKLTRYVTSVCCSEASEWCDVVCVWLCELVPSSSLPAGLSAAARRRGKAGGNMPRWNVMPFQEGVTQRTLFSPLPLRIRLLINDPPHHPTTQSLCIWETQHHPHCSSLSSLIRLR